MSASASIESQVYSVARLCLDQSFLSLCHRRRVAGLCMLYKVNAISNHCLLSDLSSASTRVRQARASAAAHPLELKYQVVKRPNLQCVSCRPRFEYGMPFPSLCMTQYNPGWVQGCSQPLVASLSSVFFSLPWRSFWYGCESNLQTTLFFQLGPMLLVLIKIIIMWNSYTEWPHWQDGCLAC